MMDELTSADDLKTYSGILNINHLLHLSMKPFLRQVEVKVVQSVENVVVLLELFGGNC